MRRRPMFAILFLGAALAAGCGTSPPSRFYTLDATAAATATTSTAAQSALVIAVGPEFVVSAGPNEVKIDDFNRWAAPLQDGLSRAVAENLVALLGTPRVVRFPQPLAIEADYRVVIEVRTFDSAPGQSAALDAVWTIRRSKDGKTQTGRTSVRDTVPDKGYDALAAAHSRAVARMSQDIAGAIAAMQRGAP